MLLKHAWLSIDIDKTQVSNRMMSNMTWSIIVVSFVRNCNRNGR